MLPDYIIRINMQSKQNVFKTCWSKSDKLRIKIIKGIITKIMNIFSKMYQCQTNCAWKESFTSEDLNRL